MRTLTALCLAVLLAGCIPIGFRGGTMPLQGATGSAIQGAADLSGAGRVPARGDRGLELAGR
jgi:hypothetical protein